MNTGRLWCGAWLSLTMSGAVALSGQGPQTLEKPVERIAVTGCVSRVESPAGTAANAENRAVGSRGTFVLLKAAASAATATSSATTNVAAKQTRTPAATQYRLNGADSMVAPYVNHQVEITGISEATAPASGAKRSAGTPTMTVESIRMLAAECP